MSRPLSMLADLAGLSLPISPFCACRCTRGVVREGRKRASRRLTPQKDGSYLIHYHRNAYRVRLRKNGETDTWDVVSVWSETWQCSIPVPPPPRADRWEALLAGTLNRSVGEGLQAAEMLIEEWSGRSEGEQPAQTRKRTMTA